MGIGKLTEQKSLSVSPVNIRKNDIARLKKEYERYKDLRGSFMNHYVTINGKVFNGFGLEEAKKILGIK